MKILSAAIIALNLSSVANAVQHNSDVYYQNPCGYSMGMG